MIHDPQVIQHSYMIVENGPCIDDLPIRNGDVP